MRLLFISRCDTDKEFKTVLNDKDTIPYSYITSKCKVTAVFNEGVARVETCCYFALMSYVTRLFTE